ncbi:MAG: AAA family ATPase [Thermodesulfobacteriota bacterium]
MLTRLEVKGFKNLLDVDLHFGPFTCIAGPNGVGKSNLFDAILFLQALADKPFLEAALGVRGGQEARHLFTTHGNGEMELAAEMLIPAKGVDTFGQPAEASSTFVRYSIRLRLRQGKSALVGDEIELLHEELTYITKGEAAGRLPFRHKLDWRSSVLHADRRAPYITTDRGVIRLHQDRRREEGKKKRGGATWEFPLASLPRTVLSSAQNAKEAPTAVLVRREMLSWRLLQLEPSALRQPDDFQAPSRIAPNGAHLPAALYRLSHAAPEKDEAPEAHEARIYVTAANRLAELVAGVGGLTVERDDKRKLLTLVHRDLQGVELPATSLSDGTLRFLALTILEADPEETGVICLEEPENGIHPERVAAMVRLLSDIAVDPEHPNGPDNPLRQVFINTHSPAVVALVEDESLLFSDAHAWRAGTGEVRALAFWRLAGTRPADTALREIQRGTILSYLQRGVGEVPAEEDAPKSTRRRVIDRFRGQLRLPFEDRGDVH